MAINLTDADHEQMDDFLEFVLDAYKDGRTGLDQAVAALAHVLTAAAIGNECEVRAWFDPDQHERWLDEVSRRA
ncbi:MAG: hypothetical protein ACT6Q3_13950 [Sphingopyxis sp.]